MVSVTEATVSEQEASNSTAGTESFVSKLARFFPEATPVRIPVRISGHSIGSRNHPEGESTVIEYGTHREVLFACRLPLEFADKVRVQNTDGSLDADAWVVAVQYHNGETAVAARFAREVANWVIKA